MPIKDYLKKKKLTFTILMIVLVATLITVGYVLPQITNPNNRSKTLQKVMEGSLDPNILPTEFVKAFSEGSMYFKNWNWQGKMVQIIVTSSSVSEDSFTGYVRNLTEKFPERQDRRFFSSCNADQTFSVSNVNPLKNVLARGFGLVSRASAGDIVYAYCMDENCVNVGKNCVLVEF